MKKFAFTATFASIAAAFCMTTGAAMADTPSKADYKAAKEQISAKYKSDKAACGSLAGNAKDICIEQAKGDEKVAKANLEANYKPTAAHMYDARVAKADADYAVAKEKCDDLAGNPKDVCVKEAKAAHVSAKANAKVADANVTAAAKTADARHDAMAQKNDADYAVAKQKCDVLAGDAKDACIKDAKMRFGQS